MNTREIASENRLSQWAEVIHERSGSGLSIREYCQKAQIKESAYYYWQRKLREEACRELVEPGVPTVSTGIMPDGWIACTSQAERSTGSIVIEVGAYRVAVGAGFDAETLTKVCRMLGSLC